VHFDPAFLVTLPVCVFSIVVHECAHGVAALACGDTTARDRGRLTLNPIPHVDPLGSLLLPGLLVLFHSPVVFGWAKPVPVDWASLRNPRNDPLKVALAGPASNFLLALLFAGLARLAPESGFLTPLRVMGYAGVVWNAALGLFNLIPIPPLDGSWVLMRFLRLRHIIALHSFRGIGMALVALLLAAPVSSELLFHGPLRIVVHAYLGLFGLPSAGLGL
jgi:Zn-dependent protease